LATVSLALQEAQAEHEALRSRIVSSPERRKRQLQDENAALDYERKESKALDEKMQEIKTKIMHVTQAIKDVPEVTDMIEEAVVGAKKQIHLKEQLDTTRVDKDFILKKKAAILEQVEEAQGSLNRMEEKIAHMRKQTKVKMNAAQEALEQATTQLIAVEQDHLDGMARVEAGELEVKAMEASIEREREKTLAEMKAMIADYHEMERKVLQQNAKLMGAIGVN
jgi:chromosome segregation ATPase